MNTILVSALLLLSPMAGAECITLDAARTVIGKHLDSTGEAEFPDLFLGKTISEKQQTIQSLVQDLSAAVCEDRDGLSKIFGYEVMIPTTGKEGDFYLVASCEGKVNVAWAEGD